MKPLTSFVFYVFCALAFAVSSDVTAKQQEIPQSLSQIQLSFAPLVKQTAPTVVNVYGAKQVVQRRVRSPLFDDPFFRRFFGESFRFGERPGQRQRQRQRQAVSLGSGVVVSADGMIVTNHHVIADVDKITVALSDGREFPATLMLDDERTDLAVLRIDPGAETLPHLTLRDSDTLEVGDLVLALGNPFNVGQTVTSGIVSALARTGVGVSDMQFFIQTDAAINPGNSGGALVTMDGRLVGINTAIYSKSGGSLGIGFAIPSNMVRVVLQSAQKGLSQVRRPWLGALLQPVTRDIAAGIGLTRPAGALISDIYDGGPAALAGLRAGDVVVSVEGQEVRNPLGLNFRIGTQLIGARVPVTYWRDGARKEATLALAAPPEQPARNIQLLEGRHPLAGATIGNLSPALADELGLNPLRKGVIVLEVANRSLARRYGVKSGDILLSFNGDAIDSVAALLAFTERQESRWNIKLRRNDRVLTLAVGG